MKEENIVNGFTQEGLSDFAQMITNIIHDVCNFADKYNFDRDNIVKCLAERLSIFAEIATINDFNTEEERK